ncbi:MAG TPA: nucleoside hydrolase, partial [Actinomycetota bacterium]|nr:nucleoside hydrolase [Actinomycetota bacterium]
MPLILDVDTGVDDALALLYACASPEVELIAATCVMGNVTVAQAVRNTLWVLQLAGRHDVEVAEGAARPLVRDHEPFPVVHGSEGLGLVSPSAPAREPSDRSAAALIVETARARPGEVQLVATGPLTNAAIAIAEEPELPKLLRGFTLMGGAFARGGNTTPAAEANIWMDPDAAQAVFRGFAGAAETKLPICVGLDVTERAVLTLADLDAICGPASDGPVAGFLRGAVPYYMDFYATTRGLDGACMHDPLAVAAAIDPSLVTLQTTRVEVETDGRWTVGETVADLLGLRRSPWPVGWEKDDNARVALDLDERAFTDRLVQRLR